MAELSKKKEYNEAYKCFFKEAKNDDMLFLRCLHQTKPVSRELEKDVALEVLQQLHDINGACVF